MNRLLGIAAALGVMAAASRGEENAPGAPGAGEIVLARGKVVAVDAAGVERVLTVGARVFVKERVVCSAESKTQIKFKDGTVVWIGEESEIVIDEYVYDASGKEQSSCGTRLVKGACRFVTGAISKLNPARFKVRTRLATLGLRGCEFAVKSVGKEDTVYVLELGERERVFVETTSNGSLILDARTGKALSVEDAVRKVVDIDRSGRVLAIALGKGTLERDAKREEIDEIARATSHLPPARYEMIHGPDGATLRLRPAGAD